MGYSYSYLTVEQAQAIILTSLAIRPMDEEELCAVVKWCDDAARNAGVLENIYKGNIGLTPEGTQVKINLLPRADGSINHGSFAEQIFTGPRLCTKDTLDVM